MATAGSPSQPLPLRIVLCPWLALGHMLPYLELAERLALRGHAVSFVSTPRNLARLPPLRPAAAPRVRFVALPLPRVDGLPDGAESTNNVSGDAFELLWKAFDGHSRSSSAPATAARGRTGSSPTASTTGPLPPHSTTRCHARCSSRPLLSSLPGPAVHQTNPTPTSPPYSTNQPQDPTDHQTCRRTSGNGGLISTRSSARRARPSPSAAPGRSKTARSQPCAAAWSGKAMRSRLCPRASASRSASCSTNDETC